MWKYDKNKKEVVIGGFEQGIAPSPFDGIADLKNVNISSIKGEVSVAYDRARLDQASITGGTMTVTGVSTTFAYTGTIKNGTWILVTAHTGSPGTTDNHYYFVRPVVQGTSFNLYSDLGVTQITSGGNGTITFNTLNMSAPINYTIEQSATGGSYRYYILDAAGIIWANGSDAVIASSFIGGSLSTSTTWQAITPFGTSLNAVDTFTNGEGSLQVMYATNSSNAIQASYLIVFTRGQILYAQNSSAWPSISGSAFTLWKTLNYTTNVLHKSILGNDQVLYFGDGPGIGIIQQKSGQQFNPATPSTYNYVDANYLTSPTDAVTHIALLPNGAGFSIVAGGYQNNIYIYPTYQNSTASGAAPLSVLYMPEANTQFLLETNNYVIIFCGNKGNVYLTNGSSVVPLLTVPDYIAGSATATNTPSFVQDPYFVWGGAMYLRGRIFFSIRDDAMGSRTGNCGGVWSFVPSFSYYPNQDAGLSLRMEAASALNAGTSSAYNGYASILFAGQNLTAQQADGPQYVAGWNQDTPSIDFSSTSPTTNGYSIIETDAIPIGSFLEKQQWSQFEVKLSAPLVSGESISVYWRNNLEGAWTAAPATITEPSNPLAVLVNNLNVQTSATMPGVQLIQFQVHLTSTASSPSWVRCKEFYLR